MFGRNESSVSLASRLTLALTGVVILVTILAGGWLYFDASQKAKTRVEEKAQQIGIFLQGVLKQPLWEMENNAIKSIGQTLMEDYEVNAVTIQDSSNNIIYINTRENEPVALTHLVSIDYEGEVIGSAQLSFSLKSLQEQTEKNLLSNAIIVLALLLSLSLSTILLINVLLKRPIKQLINLANSFGKDPPMDHGATPSSYREFQPLLQVLTEMEGQIHRQITKLSNSEERFRSLMDLSPDIVSIINNEGVLVYNSPGALSVHGYTQEEMIGRNAFDLIHQDDLAKYHAYIDAMCNNLPEPKSIQYRYRNKDGSYVWMEATTSNQLDNPHIGGLIMISRDISLNKVAQEELANAKQAAEVANRTKSEFLANMSHEIRTPITAILGFAELLHGSPLEKGQKEHLEIILASTDHLMELIEDILDLSAIEIGKSEIELSNFSLRGVAIEAINSQKIKANDKGLTIRSEIPSDVPDLLIGDKTRLKQILINLIGNAIKFTPKGEVFLSVAIEECQQKTVLIQFDVHDTGIGVRQEDLLKIFHPFEQGDNSSTKKFEGTGLGLSICTHLLKLMGGDIWAESRLGEGSTFHFQIPFGIGSEQLDSVVSNTASRSFVWEGPKLDILLVEDNVTIVHFFSELLKKHGHLTEVACNGFEALAKLRQNEPDVVLMDIQMPVMTGVEAITKLRDSEKETNKHLPVIALTAHAMEDDRDEFLDRGFDGYLSKPCKAEDLFFEIRRVLG